MDLKPSIVFHIRIHQELEANCSYSNWPSIHGPGHLKQPALLILDLLTIAPMSLLRLPPEVRDLIWEYLFAQKYIHIAPTHGGGFTHYLCSVGITDFGLHDRDYKLTESPPTPIPTRHSLPPGQAWTEEGAEAKPFNLKHSRKWTVHPDNRPFNPDDGYYAQHHKSCQHPDVTQASFSQGVVRKQTQLQLAIMHTSKLIYREIFTAVWTCNTFAFDTEDHFRRFVQARTDEQRHTLRHLVLNTWIAIDLCPGKPWDSFYLDVPAIQSLTGLKTVYISTGISIPWRDLERFMCQGTLKTRTNSVNILDAFSALASLDTVLTHVRW